MPKLSEEQLDKIREIVYEDSPRGFIIFFYFLVKEGWSLPAHCIPWILAFYEAREKGMSLAVEAARGLLKSTVFSVYMTAYQTALHPDLESIIVMASDKLAGDISTHIAGIFENNVGFRVLFPHIRPDKSAGWGAGGGYEIVDTSVSYSEFRSKRTISPSILSTTYKSANVQGRHPRLFGILDDINNSKNSRYPREMQTVKLAVDQEILPAFDRVMMRIDVFTPWREGDIGDTAKKQEDALHIRTPIYKLDENGELTDEPTWPEEKPETWIERLRKRVAPHVFAQMQLCDLKAGGGLILKEEYLHYIELEEIPAKCPVVIAVDYASVAKDQALKGRDYFALAVLGVLGKQRLVLLDGIRKHVDRAEAEQIYMNWCGLYKKQGRLLVTGIEVHGKGEEFGDAMLRAAKGWKVKLLTTGNKSKGERFENQLAPVMMGGRLLISTETNAFIEQFIEEYLSWDGMGTYYNDCLDAVYYAVRLVKGFIDWKDEDRLHNPDLPDDPVTKNPLFKFARRRSNARTA